MAFPQSPGSAEAILGALGTSPSDRYLGPALLECECAFFELPWKPSTPLTCAVSNEQFSIGDPVLQVHWYDGYPEYEGREATEFYSRRDMGLFTVPQNMLRASHLVALMSR